MMIRRPIYLFLLSFAFSTSIYSNTYVKAVLAGSTCGSLGGVGVAIGQPYINSYGTPIIETFLQKIALGYYAPDVLSAAVPLLANVGCTKAIPPSDNEHVADVAHVCKAITYFLALHHLGDTPYGLPTLTNDTPARHTALLCCLSFFTGALMGVSSSCLRKQVEEKLNNTSFNNSLIIWCAKQMANYVYISELWKFFLNLLPLKNNILAVNTLGIGYHASAALTRDGYKDIKRHYKTYRSFK